MDVRIPVGPERVEAGVDVDRAADIGVVEGTVVGEGSDLLPLSSLVATFPEKK